MMWIIIVIVIVLFLLLIFIRENKEEQERKKEKHRQIENEKAEKRKAKEYSRQIYWDCLPNIYDHQSSIVLKQVHYLIRTSRTYHISVNDPKYSIDDVCLWSDTMEEISSLLGNPTWVYNDLEGCISEMPVHDDLDIKYINGLLKNRGE